MTAVDPVPAAATPAVAAGRATTATRSSPPPSALFNEQGYDATSVSDLAVRLGLTKSAMYHHFSSKEQLLEMALATR